MNIESQFKALSDRAECFLSSWRGFVIYMSVTLFCAGVWGWDGIDRWLYISTTIVVMLLLNQGRRSDHAMHLNLDAIDPVAAHNRMEEATEREIEEARDAE